MPEFIGRPEVTIPSLFGGSNVSVSQQHYEELVRDSEQLRIIKNYVSNSKYPTVQELKTILEIKKDEVPKEYSFEEMLEEAVKIEDDLK